MKLPVDPERSVGILLHDIARLMRRDFDRRIHSLGLTQTQWRALSLLARHEGINQVCMADLLEVQPITLARLIDRLESAGWVERRPDPTDRRAFCLYLTDSAEPVLAELWKRAAETRDTTLAGLSTHQQNTLIKLLQRMKGNLSESDTHSAASPSPARKPARA